MKFVRLSNGDYVNSNQPKEIQTVDGEYIDVNRVDRFYISKFCSGCFEVKAVVDGCGYIIKSFSCDPYSSTQFDPAIEAQAWLDDFIKKLCDGT